MKFVTSRIFNLNQLIVHFLLGAFLFGSVPTWASDLRGFVEGEARLFPNDPVLPGQRDQQFSFRLSPEIYHQFDNGAQFYFIPYFRLDSADSERTHFDLRELDILYSIERWQLRFGVRKVFWGVTEVFHLVDIVNQTDLVDNPNFEEKLGQPMFNLVYNTDFGTLEFFVLPYFRERTFPGSKGRLRPPLVIDTDNPVYESSAEEWHTDFAARYFVIWDKLDLGISYFVGTSRDPTFNVGFKNGELVLIPFYEQIQQFSIDTLYVYKRWIFKLEALYRMDMRPMDYFATTFGFEYTFSGIWGSIMDLGVLVEYMYDERGAQSIFPFQNDLTFGMRWAMNDINGIEFLVAFVQDLEYPSKFVFAEASSRLTEHWRWTVEAQIFMDQPPSDLFFFLRNDDFVKLSLAYHF